MNSKDRAEKRLVGFADVFADVVNVALFSGQRIVNENTLEQEVPKSEYDANGELKEQERDVVKFWKEGNVRIALFGVENQTEIDPDMPLRVIGYDGAAYTAQVHEKNNKQRKRYPVVTIVVYYGDKPWKSPKSLLDCLDIKDYMKPYVNDYPLHILDMSQMTKEQVELFQSDFKIIADFFYHEAKGENFVANDHEIVHVKEVMRVLKALTKDERFDEIYAERIKQKGGKFTMTKFVTEAYNQGESKGKQDGRIETWEKSVISIMDSLGLNIEQAIEALKIPMEEREKVLEKIKSV